MTHTTFKIFALLAGGGGLLLGGPACGVAPGGPDYASLQISATDADGQTSDSVCTVLPVLLGSRAQNDVSFAGEFSAEIYASHEGADITFGGVARANELDRFISAERLRGGFTETLSVNTTNGRTFSVSITSGCRE